MAVLGGRLAVARRLDVPEVPVIEIERLTEAQTRAFGIADNRVTELGEWDRETLAVELQGLVDIDSDVDLTGFEAAELDFVIAKQLDSVPSRSAMGIIRGTRPLPWPISVSSSIIPRK